MIKHEMLDVRKIEGEDLHRWYLCVPGGPNAWNVASECVAISGRAFRTYDEAREDAERVLGRSVERYSKCMMEAKAARLRGL